MNYNSSAKDIFHPFKLPDGMAPSSQDIISALNEYLIDTLQVSVTFFTVVAITGKTDLEAKFIYLGTGGV
jgi:hypothetical protein